MNIEDDPFVFSNPNLEFKRLRILFQQPISVKIMQEWRESIRNKYGREPTPDE